MSGLRDSTELRATFHAKTDGFRNSTHEPKTYPAVSGISNSVHYSTVQRKPHLQSLANHVNMESHSENSTTSSTTTSAARVPIAFAGCNGNPSGEIHFDEREIFFLSPAKHNTRFAAETLLTPATTVPTTLRSSQRAGERLRSFSPTTTTVIPSYPAITPTMAYATCSANEGKHQHFGIDNCEVSSYYSDSAMHMLRSGSLMGVEGLLEESSVMANINSSSTSSLGQHSTSSLRMQNNVTFSNCVNEQSTDAVRSRGSLKRNKGRSNQSLCSCDAGADTEINVDHVRPLYEYSLERRQKTHTYTCEQNAQILMRLERERHRKSSLAGKIFGVSKTHVASADDGNENIEGQKDESSSDTDAIPPVPPPPSIKRNGSMRSLCLLQLQQRPSTNCNSNNNIMSSLNDCAKSAFEMASVIDECTTSILKCANVMGNDSTDEITQKPNIATPATMMSSSKPDICSVGEEEPSYNVYPLPSHIHDDIFIHNTKKTDPSLCFLHTGSKGIVAGGNVFDSRTARNTYSGIPLSNKYNTLTTTTANERNYPQHYQKCLSERCKYFSQSLSSFSRDYFGKHQRSKSVRPTRTIFDNHSGKHIYHADGEHAWLAGALSTQSYQSRSFSSLEDIDNQHQYSASFNRFSYQKSSTPPANVFSSNCNFAAAASLLNNASFTTLSSSNSGLKEKLYKYNQQYGAQPIKYHPHDIPSPQHLQTDARQQKHQHLHSSISSIMPWKHRSQCPSRSSSSSGTNSFRFDAAKHWLAVTSILLIIGAASVAVPLALRVAASAPFEERLRVAIQLLDQVPLIDGHNDLPWNIRKFLHNKLNDFNFDEDLRSVMPWARSHWSHTDLQRLKKGRISAQFWAAYVPCEAQHRDAVQLTLEQIDVIKRLTDRYSPQLTTCTSSLDVGKAMQNFHRAQRGPANEK